MIKFWKRGSLCRRSILQLETENRDPHSGGNFTFLDVKDTTVYPPDRSLHFWSNTYPINGGTRPMFPFVTEKDSFAVNQKQNDCNRTAFNRNRTAFYSTAIGLPFIQGTSKRSAFWQFNSHVFLIILLTFKRHTYSSAPLTGVMQIQLILAARKKKNVEPL